MLVLTFSVFATMACGGEDGNDRPTDGAESDDTQSTGSDNDTDTSEVPDNTVCIGSISGKVVVRGADPKLVSVIVCIGTCFAPISTENDGTFEWRHPIGGDFDCIPYDFDETPLHMDFRVPEAKEDFAEYAFLTVPTQAEVSDKGDTDDDLDLGDIILYALPDPAAVFSPENGAQVDLFGVSFTLGPDDLVKFDGENEIPPTDNQNLRVFKAPLDEWDPPFVSAPLSALYFLGPRWARLAGDGVPLSIEAPSDLEEGDEVTVYLLGSYGTDWGDETVTDFPDFIYLDEDGRCIHDTGDTSLTWVEDGVLQDCGRARVQDGRIVTPNVPRLTWVGIGK